MVFPMPRYHFDIIEGGTSLHDEQGEVYGSQQEAEAEARKFAVEMIRHGFSAKNQIGRTIEVREDGGEPFVRVLVLATVDVERLK
jgi:Domain of unknown function (DUF6894)